MAAKTKTKIGMELALREKAELQLAEVEQNFRGAMAQLMEVSQKLERSRAEVFRKSIALQQANKGITRLHAKMDRMRFAIDIERNAMKRNMNVAAKVIHAAETGRLEAGQNPEQHFRFRNPVAALAFAKLMATGGR